jgi:hypothetical protein
LLVFVPREVKVIDLLVSDSICTVPIAVPEPAEDMLGIFVNGFKINYAQVLKSNKKAIAYNEFMGYKIASRAHENPEVVWMSQSKKDYISYRKKITTLSFGDFNIEEPVTENDVFFEDYELERAKLFLEKLPLKQQEVYKRILNRQVEDK